MKSLVKIQNLVIKDKKDMLLNIPSLTFYEGVSTFICGTSGSGKTLLLKAISENIKYNGSIEKCDRIEVVLDRPYFFTNTLEDEFKYILLDDDGKKIISLFDLENDLKKNPNELDWKTKKLVLCVEALLNKPKIIFLDQALSFLDRKMVDLFLDYVKKNSITLINVSTNIEDSLDYEYMIVLNEGMVAIEGKTMQVVLEEKLLKRLGIGLPFYVDLSLQLKLYGLIPKVYLSKEKLVSKLWK